MESKYKDFTSFSLNTEHKTWWTKDAQSIFLIIILMKVPVFYFMLFQRLSGEWGVIQRYRRFSPPEMSIRFVFSTTKYIWGFNVYLIILLKSIFLYTYKLIKIVQNSPFV